MKQPRSSVPRKKKNATTFNSHVQVEKPIGPRLLCDMFTNVRDVHDHNTRQSGAELTLPKPKTNSMKNTFSYRGAEVWNCLLHR
jgi:hypothetical protein